MTLTEIQALRAEARRLRKIAEEIADDEDARDAYTKSIAAWHCANSAWLDAEPAVMEMLAETRRLLVDETTCFGAYPRRGVIELLARLTGDLAKEPKP